MLKPFAITIALLLLFLVAWTSEPASDFQGTTLGAPGSRIEDFTLPPADIQELVNRNHAVVVGTISTVSEPMRELPYFTTEEDFADRQIERWPYIEVVYYDIAIEEVLLDDGNIRDNARLRLMNSFWPVMPQQGERYLFALEVNPDSKSYGISASWDVLNIDDGIHNLDGTPSGYVGVTDETSLLDGVRVAALNYFMPYSEWPVRFATGVGDGETPVEPGGPDDGESGPVGNTGGSGS